MGVAHFSTASVSQMAAAARTMDCAAVTLWVKREGA
jgi:hypothetical protein